MNKQQTPLFRTGLLRYEKTNYDQACDNLYSKNTHGDYITHHACACSVHRNDPVIPCYGAGGVIRVDERRFGGASDLAGCAEHVGGATINGVTFHVAC